MTVIATPLIELKRVTCRCGTVNSFCREVLQALPMEFAMEAQSLVAISLEGSVG